MLKTLSLIAAMTFSVAVSAVPQDVKITSEAVGKIEVRDDLCRLRWCTGGRR